MSALTGDVTDLESVAWETGSCTDAAALCIHVVTLIFMMEVRVLESVK